MRHAAHEDRLPDDVPARAERPPPELIAQDHHGTCVAVDRREGPPQRCRNTDHLKELVARALTLREQRDITGHDGALRSDRSSGVFNRREPSQGADRACSDGVAAVGGVAQADLDDPLG